VSWLFSLFRRPEGVADEATHEHPGADVLAEISDGLRKLARVQARQGVRLEEIEGKIEGGFADLRTSSRQMVQQLGVSIQWDDLLDAADALDEAARAASAAGDGPMAEGLRAVGARITRFLAQREVRRQGCLGAAPDPALVRVVGTIDEAAIQEGHVARVVRAAVTDRGQLLREGEVLIARRPPPSSNGEAIP
jgi:molecular chaperone GrpE (heat shock protein)